MTDNLTKQDRAIAEASCFMLGAAAGGATNFAVYSLVTGQLVTGAAAAVVAGIGAYAYANNCSWDPSQPGDSGAVVGCQKIADGGWGTFEFSDNGGEWQEFQYGGGPISRAVEIEEILVDNQGHQWITLRRVGDTIQFEGGLVAWNRKYRINPAPGATCETSSDGTQGKKYTYTDVDDGCQINVTFLGWGMEPSGAINGVWQLENPASQRFDSGPTQGCNFNSIVRYDRKVGGGGGGGPIWFPTPPDGRDWIDSVIDALPFFAWDVINQLADYANDLQPPTEYWMLAPCEKKDDGSPAEWRTAIESYGFQRAVIERLDTIGAMFQPHLNFRHLTCKETPAPQTGDAVTINWISDQRSLASGDFLRKLFTYFDHNNSTLEATVAHWRDFTWNAGPVIVSCVGTQLGKPQVWAESEQEAKRVIGHAAAIAGVDISGAEWLVSAPRSSRYGQPGLMRVQRGVGGVLGITKRDGPSGFPEGLT